jgi:hypothetical protein
VGEESLAAWLTSLERPCDEGTDLVLSAHVCAQTNRTYCTAAQGYLFQFVWYQFKDELTTFPGLKLERRHVEVSVVPQLKHLLRTRSLNFVEASSVKQTAW